MKTIYTVIVDTPERDLELSHYTLLFSAQMAYIEAIRELYLHDWILVGDDDHVWEYAVPSIHEGIEMDPTHASVSLCNGNRQGYVALRKAEVDL